MRYELRALSFSELLDQGFQLLRNHFRLLMGIGLILYLPLGLLSALAQTAVGSGTPTVAVLVGILLSALAVLLIQPVVIATITFALGEVYLGRNVTVGAALRNTAGLLMPVMGTFLLYSVVVIIGLILLIVPGIYLMLILMLVTQIVVLERRFGISALKRSRELMRGNLARGFGITFTSFLLMMVVQTGVGLVLSGVPFVAPLATAVVQAAGFAFYSAVGVLLYFDIRCRKEAFDLEFLARSVEQRAAAGAAAV